MTDRGRTGCAWQPAASLETLQLRARVLARMRGWFADNGLLEVDTPALSAAASTDPALQSFRTGYHGPGERDGQAIYLHTSPEFPMKRLLAAGSGDIYQLCKVFRDGEYGAWHNPEFTLLEWYRIGFDHFDLMDDVERMLFAALDGMHVPGEVVHWTYRDLFREFAGIDPFDIDVDGLCAAPAVAGLGEIVGLESGGLDDWLDLVMSRVIQPRLGQGLVFVRDYPASQAALARLRSGNPPVAARFEVFLDGIELANGFHELADAHEQQQRFTADLERRAHNGQATVPMDRRLLAALEAGLPGCAGVALGIDRLLMIVAGAVQLDDVLAFPFACA